MKATVMQDRRAGFDYAAAISRCAAGDRSALHELYQRDAPAMQRVALRILGRPELAEDAVHDAFVQIWQHAANFDATRATGRGWLMAILRYRALNMRRNGAREELTDADPRLDEMDEGVDAETGLIRAELAARLTLELSGMKRSQRDALMLSCEADLSHSEVARRMGLPLGTAKSLIRRAHLHLRHGMQAALATVVASVPAAITLLGAAL